MTETFEAARPAHGAGSKPPLLAVRNVEVVYDDVDPGAARLEPRSAEGRDRGAVGSQWRRQIDNTQSNLRGF